MGPFLPIEPGSLTVFVLARLAHLSTFIRVNSIYPVGCVASYLNLPPNLLHFKQTHQRIEIIHIKVDFWRLLRCEGGLKACVFRTIFAGDAWRKYALPMQYIRTVDICIMMNLCT